MNNINCNFDKIKQEYGIKNTDYLTAYLYDIFVDLTSKNETMDKLSFINYINLPFIIAERVFHTFDKENLGYLTWGNFLEGIHLLYLGTMMETEFFIFELFDFDKDGKIVPEDVRLILTFLSSKRLGAHKTTYEINQLINRFFCGRPILNFDQFCDTVENKFSDVYFIMVYFLYENKPFKESCVKLYSLDKETMISKLNRNALTLNCKTIITRVDTMETSASPNRKILIRPTHKVSEYGIKVNVDRILKRDTTEDNEIEEDLKELANFTICYINIPTIRAKSIIDLDNNTLITQSSNYKLNVNNRVNKFNSIDHDSTMTSQDKASRRRSCYAFGPNRSDMDGSGKTVNVNRLNLTENQDIKKEILHEGELFKITKNGGERKKFYIIICARDIFYFKSNKIDKLKGLHSLSNGFVLDYIEEYRYQGKGMYYFTVLYQDKPKEYYTRTKDEAELWIKKIKEAIKYRNIYDYYSFLDHLGNGSYGNVVLGKNLKTKEEVAIKIIDKANKPAKLLEFIKTEVEIIKFCKHENIIKFVDYFESADQIFIVQEYIKGGDLFTYHLDILKNPTEEKLKYIMKQLGNGIKYLHEYGIIHRDIKPQNIMLTDNSINPNIKIVDFGLSKVIGSNEKASEFLGTINFSAPEVVRKIGYNNKIDIWSLGILIYYLLYDNLPFNDPDKQKFNVVSNICYKEIVLPFIPKISQELEDLIRLCLEKDSEKRINIDQFLMHKWFR